MANYSPWPCWGDLIMNYFDLIKEKTFSLALNAGLLDEMMTIKVRTLGPHEAIGNPEHDDYPLIKGRERMMEAEFLRSLGQAYTDMFGSFAGSVREILEMELTNNYRRAIFVSTINALSKRLGLVDNTVHCKDDKPPLCARELVSFVSANYGNPRIALVGLQPRMLEALSKAFEIRVTDMDADNIGREKLGTLIYGPEQTASNLEWCDVAIATGTTLTNDSLKEFIQSKPVIFYGVTIAAASKFLNLNRFCPYST